MGDGISWGHFSAFGGTWTDRRDAEAELARRIASGAVAADLRPALEHWLRDGYVLLRGAVAPETARRAAETLGALRGTLPVRRPGDQQPSPSGDGALLDPHAASVTVRDVLLATPIVDWLTLVFEEPPLLVDSVVGGCATPTGLPHRDPSLVAISAPLELAGARIALADGPPFSIIPGSHRLPERPFSGVARHFNPERDGGDALREHDERLLEAARAAGLQPVELPLTGGDVVLWSADLVHDDPAGDDSALVAHYCPATREPAWFATLPHRGRRLSHNAGWLVSRHAELTDAPRPPDGDRPAEAHELESERAPEPAPAPAIEVVEDALERHDADTRDVPASSAAPPRPQPTHGAQAHREGGLVGGVRRLLGRRGRP